MRPEPYFSVVIPTYNRGKFIINTLNSVLNQTFSDFEIIIIDNCSTDNTTEVLEPYLQNSKIKLIKNPKNFERSVSRNIGFQNAKGKFLTLLDSDDLMYPDNLKNAFEFNTKYPQFNFFYNKSVLVNDKGEVLYKYKIHSRNILKSICRGNFVGCSGLFISKEIYNNYTFDTDPIILGSEDWELWIRIIAKHKVGLINKINSAVLQHSDQSSSKYPIEQIIQRKDYVIRKIVSSDELFLVYKKYLKILESSFYMFAASTANHMGLFSESKKCLLLALKNDLFLVFNLRFIRVFQLALFKNKR